MSDLKFTIGDTFLIRYRHGAPGTGVAMVGGVKSGTTSYPVPFAWIDQASGLGEFRADTSSWLEGNYLFQYRQTGAGIVAHLQPPLKFAMTPGLPL